MAEERPENSWHMARRHVAEAEARLARQREIVAEGVAKGQHEDVAIGVRVLQTMATNLAVLLDHLRIEEQRHGSLPEAPHTHNPDCRR
jgi:hypothetical protein